jgi:hypothetical protein
MAEAIKRDRRRFLGDAVMTLAAVELGVKGGVGHNLPQEAPQAFAKAVVDVGGFSWKEKEPIAMPDARATIPTSPDCKKQNVSRIVNPYRGQTLQRLRSQLSCLGARQRRGLVVASRPIPP